jgi:Fe-S cluster biogenesis protein NfuA
MTGMEEKIERALSIVRPYLRRDGGDVVLVRLRPDGIAEVRWEGTCRICPMSQLTLRAGVERVLMKEVPEIRRVEAVAG